MSIETYGMVIRSHNLPTLNADVVRSREVRLCGVLVVWVLLGEYACIVKGHLLSKEIVGVNIFLERGCMMKKSYH